MMSVANWTPTAEWAAPEKRRFALGVDRGMLYSDFVGVPWVGLISIERKIGDASPKKRHLDGQLFNVNIPTSSYEAKLEAFTYPDEFERCIGTLRTPDSGLSIHGQEGMHFGLSYRTRIGDGNGYLKHYKIHLVYNAVAQETGQTHSTINDTPEMDTFSFDIYGIPVPSPDAKPTAYFSIDSRRVSPTNLALIEQLLYGKNGTNPQLPPVEDIRALAV